MTKTKRQLRAEAVERLRECRYHTLADYVRAMLGWGHEPHFEDSRDALIDLLTDEEPPEGDVISKKAVREIIERHFNRVAIVDDGSGKPIEWRDDLVCNVGFDFSSIADEIADMVERDYVRRIDLEVKDAEIEDLRDERDRMRADYERIYQFQVVETERNHWKSNAERYKAERDEWKAKAGEEKANADGHWRNANNIAKERDEWKAKALGYEHRINLELLCSDKSIIDALESRNRELTAERDKWKAKAETRNDGAGRSVTNLDWLMENDFEALQNQMCGQPCSCCMVGCEDDLGSDEACDAALREWLLSPHVDANDGDVAQDMDNGENVHMCPNDSREKLEADIAHDFYLYKKPGLERIFGWLDRQAAITERENDELRKLNHLLRKSEAAKIERIDELAAERDELKAENKLLRERKCPGYNPDRHYCEFRAQDFELNSKTVRTLKQERKKLIDILTNIGVEVRDDEFGLSFMYDNYHNLGSENERLEEQLIDARKSRDHWQRVAGKHAAEIQRLKRGLEAEREIARMWPRFEDGRPVRVGDEFTNKRGEARTVDALVFSVLNGTDYAIHYGVNYEIRGHGCPVKRPPLKAKDGQPIKVGQTLYGEDGKAWVVEGIDRKNKWSVWAHYENNTDRHKCLKPEWLTHEKPDTSRRVPKRWQRGGGPGAAAASQRAW